MSGSREFEKAGREARDAVVSRPRSSKSDAIGEALRRFLRAETYDELRRKRAEPKDAQQDQGTKR